MHRKDLMFRIGHTTCQKNRFRVYYSALKYATGTYRAVEFNKQLQKQNQKKKQQKRFPKSGFFRAA